MKKKVGLVENSMGGSKVEQYMAEVMVNVNRGVEDLCKLYAYLRENSENSELLSTLEGAIHAMKNAVSALENTLESSETTK